MTKIPLSVEKSAGSIRIIFRAIVRCKKPKFFGILNFIVDTGSPITLISLKDRERLRVSKIQMNAIISKREPITIGGGISQSKIVPDVNIKINEFETSMKMHIIDDGTNTPSHPSILGIDFLLQHKMKLVFNPTENEAYFKIGTL